MTNDEIYERMKALSEGRPYRSANRRFQLGGLIVPLVLVAVTSWGVFGSTGDVVVDSQGKIGNPVDEFRERMQGERFWRNQLRLVDRELKTMLPDQGPAPISGSSRYSGRDVLENLYRDYPELRPTAAQQEADRLREMADGIENRERLRVWESYVQRRIADLIAVRAAISSEMAKDIHSD